MKPSSFSCELSANSTASQRKVASVSPCLAMSSRLSTPDASSAPSPMKATAVPLRPSEAPNTQPATISTKITAVTRSSRDMDPMLARSLRAAAGASGVAPTPGEKIFETSSGSITIAVSVGTEEASSQVPKPISMPASFAICTPIGLHEVAVSHRAEDTARLAIAQNIR